MSGCALIVFKHIEKTAGSTLAKWFHELARRGALTYHSGWFPVPGHCAVCRPRSGGTEWVPGCLCKDYSAKDYVLSQFERRVFHRNRRPSWTFLNDSSPRPWRAVLEVHGHDVNLPDILRRVVRMRNEPDANCRMYATTVWRHPVAHWISRYAFHVYTGMMFLRKGESLPPLLEWVQENPNDQTHDLLRGVIKNRRLRNDPLLHRLAMQTLRHFDLLFPMEQVDELPRALCGALRIGAESCPRLGRENVQRKPVPDPLHTGLPTSAEWANLTRRYGAVDAWLHEYAGVTQFKQAPRA